MVLDQEPPERIVINSLKSIHQSSLSYHEHPDAIYGFTGQSAVRINNVTAYAPEASSVLDKTIRKPKKMMPGAISLNSGASTPPTHHIGGVGGGGGVEILKHTTPNLSTGRSGYVISGYTYMSIRYLGTFLLALRSSRSIILRSLLDDPLGLNSN